MSESVSDAALRTKVARGVAWAAGAQSIIAIADLVSQLLVVALWVPVADYGIAALAFPFYTMLDTAADLGVTSSLIQRDDHTPERVSTVFWFNVLISSGLFVVLLVLGPLYGHLEGHAIVGWLLVAYGGKLIFQNVYAIPFALLRKELRFSDIAVARVIAHLAESIGRIVFAAMGATIWCFTLAALTRALVFGVIMQLRHPFVPKLVFQPREVLPFVRFGVRSAASQVLYQLYTNLDYPVVGYYFGSEANGIYTLAYFIVLEPVKTIANVVTDVAFPAFARLRHRGGELVDQFIRLTRLNLLAVLPFVVLVALVVPEFLRMFYAGKNYTADQIAVCAEAARMLCVVGVLRGLGLLGPAVLDGVGRPGATLRYMAFATVAVPTAFVVFAIVFGDRLGLRSVALAWAVAYPLAFIVLGYQVRAAIALPIGRYLRGAGGIIASCAAGYAAGLAVDRALVGAGDGVRMVAVAGVALAVMLVLVARWQRITPRSIAASLRDPAPPSSSASAPTPAPTTANNGT